MRFPHRQTIFVYSLLGLIRSKKAKSLQESIELLGG
jgi:hypothetical protein